MLAYDITKFDEKFYKELNVFDTGQQLAELEKKKDYSARYKYDSVFFVGCATGLEPIYWTERGCKASGCEVSEYAVDHLDPRAKQLVRHYDGQHLDWLQDNSVDAIMSFDVLTLVPRDMLAVLSAEMIRVASKLIVIRSTITDWKTAGKDRHGVDGVEFKLESFTFWDELFTRSGKFWLSQANISVSYSVSKPDLREVVYIFTRI